MFWSEGWSARGVPEFHLPVTAFTFPRSHEFLVPAVPRFSVNVCGNEALGKEINVSEPEFLPLHIVGTALTQNGYKSIIY